MLLEQTYAKLVEMKLYGMANAIKERAHSCQGGQPVLLVLALAGCVQSVLK